MTKVQLPEWPWRPVRELADQLSLQCWLVGGAVRDLLLRRPVHDWDFAVAREATVLARRVGDRLGGAYFPLDEERGTARVVVIPEGRSRVNIDFARLRGDDLPADLKARDFTINAMAVDRAHTLIDPLGGADDLRAQRVRATEGDVFRSDPVRLLRAVRLEAELGFQIEPETESWLRRDARLLSQPAEERQRDEFIRGLAVSPGSRFIRRLDELGLLVQLVPELAALEGVVQSYPHRLDGWRHTLVVADVLAHLLTTLLGGSTNAGRTAPASVPVGAWGDLARTLGQFTVEIDHHLRVQVSVCCDRAVILKLAALFHDVGKPQTGSEDDEGRIRFFNHEVVGARIAAARLRELRFSRDEIERVRRIVREHLRPAHLARAEKFTRRAIYRYFRDTEDAGVDIVLLGLADHLATWGPHLREERWTRRLEVAELLLHHYFERREETVTPRLPLDGHDLMRELDLEPGPRVGRILDLLREAMAVGEIETREEALALARNIGG